MADIPSFDEFAMDEEEQSVLDRLSRLIGAGPATFFRDACRLARQSPGLPSASNLLAHLCREIESAIEALLVDPTALPGGAVERCAVCRAAVTDDKCEACGSSRRATHKAKKRSVVSRWGIPEDDAMAVAWLDQDSLDQYAHRRGYAPPRLLNTDFLQLWRERKASYLWLLDNFENEFLTKLKPLVASAMAKGPPQGVKDLKTLPFTQIAHHYMFSQIDSAEWIEPLVKAGFFEWPPGVSVDPDGNEVFLSWPQSRYLVCFATERPDAVCDAVLAVPDTENPWVIQDIFEIAEALPVNKALRLVSRLHECLRHNVSMPWREALPVMRRLRDASHAVEAMGLALAALKPFLEHSGLAFDERPEAIGLLSAENAPIELKDEAEELLTRLRRQQRMAENSRAFAVLPRSPLSPEAIDSMTTVELAEYVASWRPSSVSFDSPTERGLAESVCRVVDSKPEDMAGHAHLFADAPAEFSAWFLSAFTSALRRDATLPWESLLAYTEAIVSRDGEDDSTWARQEVAALLDEAFRRTTSGLDKSQWPKVWQLLARLASDSDPTPEDEAKHMGDDAFTYSLNCVRGKAVHALFAYLSSIHRESGDESFRLADHAPEVVAELDRLLSPSSDSSLAVRAAIGAFWPSLHGIDEAWAGSHAARVFPMEEGPELWRVAWVACVCWNQPSLSFFKAHRAQYLRAASELAEVEPDLSTTDYHRRFAEHLGLLMLWCAIDPRQSDEVLSEFLRRSPVTTRNVLVDFLGRCLMQVKALAVGSEGGVSEEALEKLALLADQRLGSDDERTRAELPGELGGFGLWFVSGLFDDAWSVKCLATVAGLGGKIERPDLVGKRLAELFAVHPRLVLAACEALLEGQSALLVFRGRRPEIAAMLEAAEAHDDKAIASSGRRLRSRLVARGFIAYGT